MEHHSEQHPPSVSCYRNHKCRCEDCTVLNTDRCKRWRAGLPPTPNALPRTKRTNPPLDEETLTRLRRAVGLIK